jgi:hypothetical protein
LILSNFLSIVITHHKINSFFINNPKFFKFQVLPLIAPFTFGDEEMNIDESVSATCSVTKGDMPLKIWWTLQEDNQAFSYNLTTNDGIVVTRTSKKVNTLLIEALKARHRGNYTCFVQNKAGHTSHSAYLAING